VLGGGVENFLFGGARLNRWCVVGIVGRVRFGMAVGGRGGSGGSRAMVVTLGIEVSVAAHRGGIPWIEYCQW